MNEKLKTRIQNHLKNNTFVNSIRTGTEHDMQKHAHRSDTDILNRILSEEQSIVSVFNENIDINAIIHDSISENIDMLVEKIDSCDEHEKFSINHVFDKTIGHSIQNANNKLKETLTNVTTIVFQKDIDANNMGIKLVTAYPCVDTKKYPNDITVIQTDLKPAIMKTKCYKKASPLEKAHMENMCNIKTPMSYVHNNNMGNNCTIKTKAGTFIYIMEINGYTKNMSIRKQNMNTKEYSPVFSNKPANHKHAWQNVTSSMYHILEQNLPKLTQTANCIKARALELETEQIKQKQKNSQRLQKLETEFDILSEPDPVPQPDYS